MDLLLGPLFNSDGEGVVLRHTLLRTLSSLAGMCDDASEERKWIDSRMCDIGLAARIDEAARVELRCQLGKVLSQSDGVDAVRKILFGPSDSGKEESSSGDPDSGVGLSWALEMDYVDEIEELKEQVADMSGGLKLDVTHADAVTQCGDEFVRQVSEMRAGMAEMVRQWEDKLHSITGPGDELFHSPHDGGYSDEGRAEGEMLKFIPIHEFGRLSSKCTCTLGLNMEQQVERMLKVRADVRDVAVYRMGLGCTPIQLGELAVLSRSGVPTPVPIVQVLSGGLVVVTARELFGCAGDGSPDRFSMFLRNDRRVRFVTLGKYREPQLLRPHSGGA